MTKSINITLTGGGKEKLLQTLAQAIKNSTFCGDEEFFENIYTQIENSWETK